jgi:hypothetical protein
VVTDEADDVRALVVRKSQPFEDRLRHLRADLFVFVKRVVLGLRAPLARSRLADVV